MKSSLLFTIVIVILLAAGTAFVVLRDDNTPPITGTGASSQQSASNTTLTNQQVTTIEPAIPGTGQTRCYDTTGEITCPIVNGEYFGQDAQYAYNLPSYTDNDDGTVTDNNTGLMWVKDAGEKSDYTYPFSGDTAYSFAGYTDWRYPTIKELYSLINFNGQDIDPAATDSSGLSPFIDNTVFEFAYGDVNNGDRIIDSQWQTSDVYVSTVMDNQQCFFGVNFADGRIKCYPTQSRGNGYFLRLVRGPVYGENRFVDNADGTITDESSGLMWQQSDSTSGLDWPNALAYCSNLELAEYDDWRLPNAKELQYIVDYTRSPDTTASAALDPVFSISPITNEAGERDYPFFWTSTTHANVQGGSQAVYIAFGTAIGKMNDVIMDVHGAGAQRSDPKTGNAAEYPSYFGPQGDVRRVFNFARCVREQAELLTNEEVSTINQSAYTARPAVSETSSGLDTQTVPPQEAVDACVGGSANTTCSFPGQAGTVTGTCQTANGQLACVP